MLYAAAQPYMLHTQTRAPGLHTPAYRRCGHALRCVCALCLQVLIVRRVAQADAVLGLRAKVKSDAAVRQAAKVCMPHHVQ